MKLKDFIKSIETNGAKVLAIFKKNNDLIFSIAPKNSAFPYWFLYNLKNKTIRDCNIIDEFRSAKERDNALIYPESNLKHSETSVMLDIGLIAAEEILHNL